MRKRSDRQRAGILALFAVVCSAAAALLAVRAFFELFDAFPLHLGVGYADAISPAVWLLVAAFAFAALGLAAVWRLGRQSHGRTTPRR